MNSRFPRSRPNRTETLGNPDSALRNGNLQLPAYGPDEPGADLAMPRDGRRTSPIGTAPLRVLPTFGNLAGTVSGEVPLEIAALHGVKVSSSGSLLPTSASSSGASMRRRASMTFSRASSRVRP